MAPLLCSDTASFLPHILTTGLRLGALPSTACFSTRTHLLPISTPSLWLRLFLSQTSHINTPTISSQLFFLLTLPMKMEQNSKTSAYKNQMPGNHPKERIQRVYLSCTVLGWERYFNWWVSGLFF